MKSLKTRRRYPVGSMVKFRRRKQQFGGTTVEVEEVRRCAQSLFPRLDLAEAGMKEKVPGVVVYWERVHTWDIVMSVFVDHSCRTHLIK
jgi:hypothetical protein